MAVPLPPPPAQDTLAPVTALEDSTVTVTLRAWMSPQGYRDTQFDLIKAVKGAFQGAGLTFAYPHQVAVETRPWTPPDRERQARARTGVAGEATPQPEPRSGLARRMALDLDD